MAEGRTPIPGVCTGVTIALVLTDTDESGPTGGGEYGEAQGERLFIMGSSRPLAVANNEALVSGRCAGVNLTLVVAGVDELGLNPLITVPAVTGRDFMHARVLFLPPPEGHFLSPIVLIVFRMD